VYKTVYLDISQKFLDANGELPRDIMPDGLHPKGEHETVFHQSFPLEFRTLRNPSCSRTHAAYRITGAP
jgi:hypothetical protein